MDNQDRVSAAARRAEGGFSIIEVMLALSVFAVVVAAMSTTLTGAFSTTRLNRHRSVAAHVASREMDLVRSSDVTTLPVGLLQSNVNVDGVNYTVNRESNWVSKNATTGPCDGPSGSQVVFLRVGVTVTWPTMGPTEAVESETILSPPAGTYSPYTGHVSVKVLNAAGQPRQGQLVSVTGPSSTSQITSSDGCAFFAHLAAGSYTVTLNTSGYVDGQGAAPATQTAGVTAGQTTAVIFDYDQAATLNLTLAGTSGGAVPANVPITIANTKLLPTGVKAIAGTGTARTIGNLFPYGDGYQAWAGNCADADPQAIGGGGAPLYPGATRQPVMATPPGGSAAQTTKLATVIVTVKKAGVPQAGLTVTANHNPDSVCSGGNVFTLGTTNAAGAVTAALPYGSWRMQVTGKSPSGSWPTTLLSPMTITAVAIQVNIL